MVKLNALSLSYQDKAQAAEILVELRDGNESRVARERLCPGTESLHQSAPQNRIGCLKGGKNKGRGVIKLIKQGLLMHHWVIPSR